MPVRSATDVVIAGGSVAGLASALAIAERGHRVLVLERGPAPPEGPVQRVAATWTRPTVPQAQHSHTLTSLGVAVLRERAPHVLAAAMIAGAVLLDLVQAMPEGTAGRVRGDEELVALGCRRCTLELVLYRTVRAMSGVEIRHDTRVSGVTLHPWARRVTGVLTGDGERIPARLVLDATGRRALARSWLADAGVGLADDRTSPSGMRGFSRFYLRDGPPGDLNRGNAAGIVGDHYAGVLHPGDGDTFAIALGTLPTDSVTRDLRRPEAFTAVAMATPGIADWLGSWESRPISPVRAMTFPPNLLRTLATSSAHVIAGIYPVGDAACVTNPLYGRGISLALAHAFRLADLLDEQPEVGPEQARAAADLARRLYQPWYEQAAADDAERIARWQAAVAGHGPPAAPTDLTLTSVGGAARRDATVWRGLTRVLMGLAPPAEVFGDAAFARRVRWTLRGPLPPPLPAPTRAELVTVIAGERGGRW